MAVALPSLPHAPPGAVVGSPSPAHTHPYCVLLGAGAFLIVALDRQNGESILQPQSNVLIQAGDGVAVVGRPWRAHAMETLFSNPKSS